jgi:mono/diheme cytochrome c family protein
MKRGPTLGCTLGIAAALAIAEARPASAGQTPTTIKGERMEGQNLFKSYCASCHGQLGKGDGPAAKSLKPPPSDLTRLAQQNGGTFPSDEVRKIIDGRRRTKPHGTQMPEWGDAFTRTTTDTDEHSVARRIEGLVKYIESLQLTDPATR